MKLKNPFVYPICAKWASHVHQNVISYLALWLNATAPLFKLEFQRFSRYWHIRIMVDQNRSIDAWCYQRVVRVVRLNRQIWDQKSLIAHLRIELTKSQRDFQSAMDDIARFERSTCCISACEQKYSGRACSKKYALESARCSLSALTLIKTSTKDSSQLEKLCSKFLIKISIVFTFANKKSSADTVSGQFTWVLLSDGQICNLWINADFPQNYCYNWIPIRHF
jgi:hypothetical protein